MIKTNDISHCHVLPYNSGPAPHLCKIPCRSLPLICEADSGFTPRPVVHCDRTADFNVLIYLKSGKIEIIEDNTVYTLTPGTLFFLKHHVRHWGQNAF